jgi:AMMECR1 domain-containing protein
VTSPFPPFAWQVLRRPLRARDREALAKTLRALLRFQRTLGRWPAIEGAPDATPFVSLYADGRLRGCYGSNEGAPAERLARAFLHAQDDDRFGGISPAERAMLMAQVSYPRNARLANPATVEDEMEPGTHGVALVRDRAPPVLLLPHVARDEGFGSGALLSALQRKAGLGAGDYGGGGLYVFETDDVVSGAVDPRGSSRRGPPLGPEALAAAWLAARVDVDGRVAFAIDPRTRARIDAGVMAHGRAAVAVQALAAYGQHPALVARARPRLATDIAAALRGAPVENWPAEPAAVAGTLALAVLAGVDVRRELCAFASGERVLEVARSPWHAAQVVAALGRDAPAALWAACVEDLERHAWAPWTAIAASVREDRALVARAARALADALRTHPPHRGGASVTPVPEVALTAVSVEALARHRAPWAQSAAARGREFLTSMQLTGGRLYAALDPLLARGGFPASPAVDLLRVDVTGHALLALLAASKQA